MGSNKLPTLERLNEVLDYDPETGVFRWKKAVNGRIKVGDIAGAYSGRDRGYRQVHLYKGKYVARIKLIGKEVYLGRYDTAEEAYEAYKKAAKEYHGDFYNGGGE